MNGFPNSWALLPVSEAAQNITITGKKIPQKHYLESGTFPVFDQGQEYIGGYTDDASSLVECTLPVLVFGDHTRIVKLVKTPFAPGADGVKILEPKSFFEPRLFEYFVRYLVTKIPNNGYARHYQHLAKSSIPIPPSSEQHRIVAKIEELFSELDKGVESLKTAQTQLKVYGQALLKHAFEGKLTAQWRADNPDKLEPADALLKRIQQDRAQRYQRQLTEWEVGGKQGSKPKAPKTLLPLTEEDLAESCVLPETWSWVKFSGITENFDGKRIPLSAKERENKKGPYPYYGACSIIDHVDDYIFEGEYLLIGEDGANLLSKSKSLAFSVSGKFWVNNHAHIVQTLNCCRLKFLEYQFSAMNLGKFVTGTAQPKLTQANLDKVPVALCSSPEQLEIIENLDAKFSEIDQLEYAIAQSLQQAEALRQSILKKAFSGQLVQQDASDEPASALLARIQAEKAAQPSGKKARK